MPGISWKQALERVQRFDRIAETKKAIEDNSDKYVELIQEQLYTQGEDSTGKKLKPYKNKRYAQKKHGMNPLPGLGNPDLYLTGSTYKGMDVQTNANGVEVKSTTSYFPKLIKDRGDNAVRLQEKNKFIFRQEVLYPALKLGLSRVTGFALK